MGTGIAFVFAAAGAEVVVVESDGDRFAPPQLLVDEVAAGELGRRTGRGFYDRPAPG